MSREKFMEESSEGSEIPDSEAENPTPEERNKTGNIRKSPQQLVVEAKERLAGEADSDEIAVEYKNPEEILNYLRNFDPDSTQPGDLKFANFFLKRYEDQMDIFNMDPEAIDPSQPEKFDKRQWEHFVKVLEQEVQQAQQSGGEKRRSRLSSENYLHLPQDDDGNYLVPGGVDRVSIESGMGYSREIIVPKLASEKTKYMREALAIAEAATTESGDPVAERQIRRVDQMIEALREPEYRKLHDLDGDPNKDIGIILSNELQARKKFRELFLRFESAQDVKSVAGLLQQFRTEYLNTITHIPEVMAFFTEYDINAQDYIKASKTDSLEEFQKEIIARVKRKNPGLKDTDLEWARRLGERLWMVTGRLAAHDKKLEGKFTGGVFFTRRLFNFHQWLIKNKDAYHLKPELMADVDIGNQDFLTMKLPKKIYDIEFNNKKQAFIRGLVKQGMTEEDAEKEADKKTNQEVFNRAALVKIKDIFGFEPEVKKPETEKNIPQYDWSGKIYTDEARNIIKKEKAIKDQYGIPDPKFIKLVDLSKVKWNEIDFSVFDPISPMLQWSIYNLSLAEELRDNLKSDFLKKPSSEAFAKTQDKWEHLDEDQWEEKSKLIRNFANYVWHGEGRKKGEFPKFSRADIDAMAATVSYQMGLNTEQSIEVSKMVLGDTLLAQLLIIHDMFKAEEGLGVFIWEVIKGIIQQSFGEITKK